jgi:AcrR family transcriptional regulator
LTDHDLLLAAIALVEERGFEGLTLRPLAQQLGITVSALSHRFGQRSDVVARLCATAALAEQAVLEAWRARIGSDARLAPADIADVADAVLDDLTRNHGGLARLQGELVQAAAVSPDYRAPLADWLAIRRSFWSFLSARQQSPVPYDLGEALQGLAIDELAYGTALGTAEAYRWMRKLCLGRLCAGLFARDGGWDAVSFETVWRELGDDAPDRFVVRKRSATIAAVAPEIAGIILTQGGGAVTYRSVAGAAGVAASTLVYHFPTQSDLLRAGLEDIIRRAHARIDAMPNDLEDVRVSHAAMMAAATLALSLSTRRYPDLNPFVADMRRRRGENGLAPLRQISAAPERIDRLTAQAVSVVAMGALLLARVEGRDGEPPIIGALFDQCRGEK